MIQPMEYGVSLAKKLMWINASFMTTAILLEEKGSAIEGACWLHPVNDAQYINLAEFNAMLKG